MPSQTPLVNMPVAFETRIPTGRRRTNIEKLTDRLNTPDLGTRADGLKLALALLWERRDMCAGATPVLVCHDEVGVECDTEQAAEVKVWLEKVMIEGMNTVLNSTDEGHAPVEVEELVDGAVGDRLSGFPEALLYGGMCIFHVCGGTVGSQPVRHRSQAGYVEG
jgi:hypothetical protein